MNYLKNSIDYECEGLSAPIKFLRCKDEVSPGMDDSLPLLWCGIPKYWAEGKSQRPTNSLKQIRDQHMKAMQTVNSYWITFARA